MKPYFEKMKEFGQELKPGQIKSTEASVKQIQEVDTHLAEAIEKVKNAGMPAEKINARGYAYVQVEVRGTGASFGVHETEYSIEEMADYVGAVTTGNGRIGAMIFGKVGHERISLNEETVWSGMQTNWNRPDANR